MEACADTLAATATREAIEGHLDTLNEFGNALPETSSRTEEIEVTVAA